MTPAGNRNLRCLGRTLEKIHNLGSGEREERRESDRELVREWMSGLSLVERGQVREVLGAMLVGNLVR